MPLWLPGSAQLSVHVYSPDTRHTTHRHIIADTRALITEYPTFYTTLQVFTIKIPNTSTRTELCVPVACWAVRRSWSMQCGLESGELLVCCRHGPAAGAGASKYTAAAPPTSSHLNKGYILHTALSHHTTSPSHSQHFNTQPTEAAHRTTVRHFRTTHYHYLWALSLQMFADKLKEQTIPY